MASTGNILPRFVLSVAVAAFYAFYVVQALRTGRARKFLGGWVAARDAPLSYWAAVALGGGLAVFALYFAVKSGTALAAR